MASGAASGVIYLVDAHSLIFQVFHAIPAMTSPSGLPTNAVFGFVRDLLYLRRRKPDYLVCAFDRPGTHVSLASCSPTTRPIGNRRPTIFPPNSR